MQFGLTGNIFKEEIWKPIHLLIQILQEKQKEIILPRDVAEGLFRREYIKNPEYFTKSSIKSASMLFSFGGDGTLIRSVHDIATEQIPILGINIGRLGFLADVEVKRLREAIEMIERKEFKINPRFVLSATKKTVIKEFSAWALNEFVVSKTGSDSLITVETYVNNRFLVSYWADGLIISTPTGSTAYSLSAGGPILMPGCEAIVLTPLAPHALTQRPIVLPNDVEITLKVHCNKGKFVFSVDGKNNKLEVDGNPIEIKLASHVVNLIELDNQDYFETLRSKLGWGTRFDRKKEILNHDEVN